VTRHIDRFRRNEEGVALVEFAIFLPLFLLAFFVVVEFSRLFFSYQGAVVGVRDATRYMARTVRPDICIDSGGADTVYGAQTDTSGYYYQIVFRNMSNELNTFLPENVTLNQIRPRVFCVDEVNPGDYRSPTVPMAEIRADFTITFPFVGILRLNNLPVVATINRTVRDQSRVFGV
jgi:Flp pilus assembly pilin Flp